MSTPSKDYLSTVLIAPHVTEKTARIATEGNQYVFRVRRDATKPEIKRGRRVHVRSEGGHRARREPAGQGAALRALERPHAGLEESLRPPRRGADDRTGWQRACVSSACVMDSNMALKKLKPTSPGTRFQLRPTARTCTRAARYARSSSATSRRAGATTSAASRRATRAAGTSTSTASSTSAATRTASSRRSSASSTTRTARRTSRCSSTRTASAATSSRRRACSRRRRAAARAPIRRSSAGNAMQLRHIPVGSIVHNIELKPGKGGQIARSAGSSAQFSAPRRQLRDPAPEVRRDPQGARRLPRHDRRSVGNDEHNLRSYGKAGAKRWRGIRPTVRGVGDEPGRPPARRRRGPVRPGQPAPGFALGLAHQGQEDAQEQAHRRIDRAAAQEGSVSDDATFTEEGPVRRSAPREEGAGGAATRTTAARSRPGRAAR